LDHESRQRTRHTTGDPGPVVRSSDGISVPYAPTGPARHPGYRITEAPQGDFCARVLLARAQRVSAFEATDNEREFLEQEARRKYQARQAISPGAAVKGLEAACRMAV
jgi:hypothetical protein